MSQPPKGINDAAPTSSHTSTTGTLLMVMAVIGGILAAVFLILNTLVVLKTGHDDPLLVELARAAIAAGIGGFAINIGRIYTQYFRNNKNGGE